MRDRLKQEFEAETAQYRTVMRGAFPEAAKLADELAWLDSGPLAGTSVAITRARRELVLVYARQRTLFGARGFNAPSQFIAEIPENLIEHERRPAAFGSTGRG